MKELTPGLSAAATGTGGSSQFRFILKKLTKKIERKDE